MSQLLKALQDERKKVWESEAEPLLQRAEREKRDLTPAEKARYDEVSAQLDELRDRIDQTIERLARESAADQARAGVEPFLRPATERRSYGRFKRSTGDEELDEFIFGSAREMEVSLADVERTLDVQTGRWQVRDLYTGSGTGANVTPTSFRRVLYEYLVENSAIRQTNATVLNTPSGEELVLPKVTAHTSGGTAIVQEGSVIPEADPVFGQGTLTAYKYGDLVQVSSELMSDNGLGPNDLLTYLARSFARALGNGSGAHYVVGNGTSQPHGVIPALGTVVQVHGGTGVAGKPTADNIIDLYYAVPPAYRRNAFWLMSDSAAQSIRKLKDAEDRYIWVSGGLDASPDTLMGRPVVVDPNVPAAATNGTSILFGDFSAFHIRDVGTVRFERSDDFAFDRDMSTFRCLMRTDSELLDDRGIGSYVGGTA